MRATFFSVRAYEQKVLETIPTPGLDRVYLGERLTEHSLAAAEGSQIVSCFTCDHLNEAVLRGLWERGVRLISLRSAGFNHVDLKVAAELGLPVVRVPDYSPYAVAEHAVALLLCLDRKLHRAYNRVREMNFSLEGLVGFDIHGKTVGILGGGRIGKIFAKIMTGFGCEVLAYDPRPDSEMPAQYVSLEELLSRSDIISLHAPLTPDTHHILDTQAFAAMKKGAILINTGRGGLVDAVALIEALKSGHLAGAGLDVYEEEDGVFFHDLSESGINDDTLARLLTFPNVLITSHQAFLTTEALEDIARTTLDNIRRHLAGEPLLNEVRV